jgi:hypothetical protein
LAWCSAAWLAASSAWLRRSETVGGVALAARAVGGAVIAHARQELARVGPFHEVVVGAAGEGAHLDLGAVLGRQQDHGNMFGGRIGAQRANDVEAVGTGHAQVGDDHAGGAGNGGGDGLVTVRQESQCNIGAALRAVPDQVFGERFIVDQQYGTGHIAMHRTGLSDCDRTTFVWRTSSRFYLSRYCSDQPEACFKVRCLT